MLVITAHCVERILRSLRRGCRVGGRVLDLVDLPTSMVLRLRVMAATATISIASAIVRMLMMLAMLVPTSLVAPLLLMMRCLHHLMRLMMMMIYRRWLERIAVDWVHH